MAAQGRRPRLGPVVGVAVTGPLGAWLAARALAAGAGFSGGPGAVGAGELATVVSVALLWTGCAAAAWYFLTCAAVVMVLLARAAGTGAEGLEHAVRRWGFPLLRRTLLSTAAAGASLSLSVGAAGAAQSAHEAPLPPDLGWGASTVATQPPVGAAIDAAVLPLAGGPAGAEDGSGDTAPPAEETGTTPTASEELSAEAGAATSTSRARTGPVDGGRHTPAQTPPTDAVATTAGAAGAAQGTASSSAAARPSAAPTTTTVTATATAPNPTATAATSAGAQGRSTSEQRTTYLVQPGDSLWSIAESHLGPDAADAEVAQAWPRWYAANRPDVGPDPHLIHPGQLLQIPNEEAS